MRRCSISLIRSRLQLRLRVRSWSSVASAAAVSGMPDHTASPRVLSIQSHVVHGYVGNKCAVFPLQLQGFDVDPINSVQFSNHAGYPSHQGTVMNGEELWNLVQGMQESNLLEYTHLLTGYIGSVSVLETIVRIVSLLRERNPDLIYVCDPVMGDNDHLYVAKELVPAYKNQIISLATVLTPNQYEAELLTGIRIDSKKSASDACQALHVRGVATVVLTSIQLPDLKGEILLIGSTQVHQQSGCSSSIQANIPLLDAYFTGTGDLMTALLLANLYKDPSNMQHAVEQAIASLQAVLQASAEVSGPAAQSRERSAEVCKTRELRLIQNQHLILSPPVKLKVMPLDTHAD